MAARRRKRVLWTSTDVKLLRNLAGKQTVARIARASKRSVAAVRFKAHTKRIRLAMRQA